MTQRPLATITLFFGILAVISVFMPWHVSGLRGAAGAAAEPLARTSGIEEPFSGVFVLALAAVGCAALGYFTWRRTGRALSRALLAVAVLGFAGAAAFVITDLGKEVAEAVPAVRSTGLVTSEHGPGIWIALSGSLAALLFTLITIRSPKTPYRD